MLDADAAVRDKALELGFDAVGVAAANVPLTDDFERYRRFVREGMHASMGYLAEHVEVRRCLDAPGILPGARSVICVAQRYAVDEPATMGIVDGIAKYARGMDYHNHVRRRLRKLAEFVRRLGDGIAARPMIDTAPVLERAWAARAGLGFIGKNGMLIRPGIGSFTVLGEVVTTLVLAPDTPIPPRCGDCDACLEACPTAAFVRPYVLDARRCISYLTIEHRGEWTDTALVDAIAPRWFGCDACQDVCPFNRGRGTRIPTGGLFDPLDRWRSMSRVDLLLLSAEDLSSRLEGSAVRRASVDGLRRNAIGSLQGELAAHVLAALRQLSNDQASPGWLQAMAAERVKAAQGGGS